MMACTQKSKQKSCGSAEKAILRTRQAKNERGLRHRQKVGDFQCNMCQNPVTLVKCLYRLGQKMGENAQFDNVWFPFSFPGAVPVVMPLISRSPIAPWEEPLRSQQTRPTHNHIISISSATWPTDHKDQSLALDENALSGPSDKHAAWKKTVFLISNSGLICGTCLRDHEVLFQSV